MQLRTLILRYIYPNNIFGFHPQVGKKWNNSQVLFYPPYKIPSANLDNSRFVYLRPLIWCNIYPNNIFDIRTQESEKWKKLIYCFLHPFYKILPTLSRFKVGAVEEGNMMQHLPEYICDFLLSALLNLLYNLSDSWFWGLLYNEKASLIIFSILLHWWERSGKNEFVFPSYKFPHTTRGLEVNAVEDFKLHEIDTNIFDFLTQVRCRWKNHYWSYPLSNLPSPSYDKRIQNSYS